MGATPTPEVMHLTPIPVPRAETGGARRYRVLGTLGAGGFGKVYHALYLGPRGFERAVALKVILPGSGGAQAAELAARLRDEAKLLGRLDHPAILRVSRLTLVQGCWAVEMEHVPGVDLQRVIRSGRPLSMRAILEAGAVVADALAYVHEARDLQGRSLRLVHRDIKPSNVMITARGEVKVLDFGIAKAEFEAREGQTAVGLVLGTLEYMAPERYDGDSAPPSDVYALGATLLAVLRREGFGRALHDPARHDEKVCLALQALEPFLPGDPGPLLDLLYGTMRYDVAQRPTAREVAAGLAELAACAEGPPLRAWAADVVPELVAEREAGQDGAEVGRELVEHSEGALALYAAEEPPPALEMVPAVTPPEVPDASCGPFPDERLVAVDYVVPIAAHPAPAPLAPAEARPTWSLAPLLAFALAGGLLVAAGLVFLVTRPLPLPERAGAPQAPVEAPAGAVEAAELPVAAPGAPTAPRRAVAPAGVSVRVEGAGVGGVLVQGSQRIPLPARVSPGRYELEVSFGDGAFVPSGSVEVQAGAPLVVSCDPTFLRCAAAGR